MSTDITPANNAAANLPEVRALIRRLEMDAVTETATADRFAIMEAILAAESEDELFEKQEAGTVSSKDYLNKPFRLLPENITWKKSGQSYIDQGGFPFYVLLRVTEMATGDDIVIDCGSFSVISVLDKLLEFDTEDREPEKRSFERFRADGGRPLQFVGKQATNGTVVLLKPVAIEAKPKQRA